ncbi:MAG: hypothetical protein IIX35_01620 [Paraprevotella sp.]|nr:hypothetical protein [Paraprevotella sp.]
MAPSCLVASMKSTASWRMAGEPPSQQLSKMMGRSWSMARLIFNDICAKGVFLPFLYGG